MTEQPMPIRIDHYHHFPADPGVDSKLADILRVLHQLSTGVQIMNQSVQNLVDSVAAQKGEIASMKVFIAGLEQAIKDALSGVTLPPDVQTAVDGVFADVTSNTQAIKDAIDNDPTT